MNHHRATTVSELVTIGINNLIMSELPLDFHITFRAYGTWLHGNRRGSVDLFHNRYGTPRLPRNEQWENYNRTQLTQAPVKLKSLQRRLIEKAIREVCETRK